MISVERNPNPLHPRLHRLRAYFGAHQWSPVARTAAFIAGLSLALIGVVSFQPIPSRVTLSVGDVAPESIKSPQSLTYVSQLKTRERQDAAAAAVPEVYEIDAAVGEAQRQRLLGAARVIEDLAQYPALTDEQKISQMQRIEGLDLSADTATRLLALTSVRRQAVGAEVLRVLDDVMAVGLREGEVAGTSSRLPELVRRNFSDVETTVIVSLVRPLLKVNRFPNPVKTEAARKTAREAVQPVRETLAEGEIIIRDGDVVTLLVIERLEVLGLLQPRISWQSVAGSAILVVVLTLLLGLYIHFYHPYLLFSPRRMLLLAAVFLAFTAVAKFVIPGHGTLPYGAPFSALALLVAALINSQVAIFLAVVFGVLAGEIGGGSLEVTAYMIAGSVAGIFVVRRMERMNVFVYSGVAIAAASLAVLVAFRLPDVSLTPLYLARLLLLSAVNGGAASIVAMGTFSVLGSLFGVMTILQLLELAHPNQPLQRRLMMESPGTYQHSVLVGNLGERAAEAIGADALLVRVAAYYHDVGKLTRPQFFAENQTDGHNPHHSLDPDTSARIITSHVTDGVALAGRYHLPSPVTDIIAQHHGTRLASFFLRQAQEQNPDMQFDERDFRYVGPRPQTREAAILMLADAAEAVVRASKDHTAEQIKRLVDKVVEDRLREGQLDESDLTLREINKIKAVFLEVFQGIYHARIEYPDTADLTHAGRH